MLEISEYDREYFDQVVAFAERMGLKEKLDKQIEYLERWARGPGCTYEGYESVLYLYRDFAPHSFTFRLEVATLKEPPKTILCGGLIYQGPLEEGGRVVSDGSFPSLTVSLDNSVGWHVHT